MVFFSWSSHTGDPHKSPHVPTTGEGTSDVEHSVVESALPGVLDVKVQVYHTIPRAVSCVHFVLWLDQS